MTEAQPFWEQPETVERFSGRDPDLRLMAMVEEGRINGDAEPAATRILDLGCAGGRNTVFLAERGFDVIGVDASRAMVAETRRRLGAVLGEAEARARVRLGRMDRLTDLADQSFDLVVALGVLHSAGSRTEWEATLKEVFRVLRPGGKFLVANHTDQADLDGRGLTRVPGDDPIYERTSGLSFLVSAEQLDEEMARQGFERLLPTETVRRETDRGGVRVTANGLYSRGQV